MLDRFSMIVLSDQWGTKKEIPLKSIKEDIRKAQEFAFKSRNQEKVNSQEDFNSLELTLDSFTKKNLIPEAQSSFRRYQSLIRVARTIADLNESDQIKAHHIDEASEFTFQSFKKMQGKG
jgi:magnesium chelatase family protein